MRFKKIILSFVLVFAFICSNFINVSALNEIQVSELFKEYFTEVFLNPDAVTVISKDDRDITMDFFDKNKEYFEENNFGKIKEYYRDFIEEIFIKKDEQNNIQTRSPFVTNSVSKFFYKELHKNQANGEISWYLKGTYVWDRATGRITSTTNGAIVIDRINFGQAWTSTVNNVRTRAWLDEDDTRANFSGSFNLKTEMKQNYVTVFSVDFGTLSCQASGQPHE